MKKNHLFVCCFLIVQSLGFAQTTQDFSVQIEKAKLAYSKQDIEDSRFNMLLALQQLDLKIGSEVLKLLPLQLISANANTSKDQLHALSSGFIGASFNRTYGVPDSSGFEIEIVSNSPLIGGLNVWLNNPMMAGMSGKKTIKLEGYKAAYSFEASDETDSKGTSISRKRGELQIPVANSLITLRSTNYTEDQLLVAARMLPVGKIAELLK